MFDDKQMSSYESYWKLKQHYKYRSNLQIKSHKTDLDLETIRKYLRTKPFRMFVVNDITAFSDQITKWSSLLKYKPDHGFLSTT